jgi:membrane protein YqaA with SNARE-associated domain
MITSLTSLFVTAFIAATLFPTASEAVLVALLVEQTISPIILIATASLGNTMGSILNWWMGKQIERFHNRSWFPVKPEHLLIAKQRFHRYGEWSLLLSWVPIIGDPLTVAAGILGMPLWRFTLYVAVAKTTRYCAVAFATLGIIT